MTHLLSYFPVTLVLVSLFIGLTFQHKIVSVLNSKFIRLLRHNRLLFFLMKK